MFIVPIQRSLWRSSGAQCPCEKTSDSYGAERLFENHDTINIWSLRDHRSSESGKILVVAHTDDGGLVRIISARDATPGERKSYEEN